MVTPDIFEAYINISLPKDISFLSSVKFPSENSSTYLPTLTQYHIVKQRVEDFSSDKSLVNLYSENPLNYINSEILKKDVSLRQSFDSKLLELKKSVDNYSGAHIRKANEVNSELAFLSLVHTFVGSNVDFDKIRSNIQLKINSKVYSNKKSSKKSFSNKFNVKQLLYAATLVGGMYLGSVLFPKEKEVFTTVNRAMYENSSLPLEKKLNQFVFDRNLLLKYESNLVNELVDENNKLKGDY